LNLRRLWSVTRKELQHILRDRQSFILVFFTPLFLLLVMAYALTVEINHVPVAVLDEDRSGTSRTFYERIFAGEDLDLYRLVESMDEIEHLFMTGQIKAALVIGSGFSDQIYSLQGMPLQVIIDGTEPESGGFALDHIGRRAEEVVNEILTTQMQAMGLTLETLYPIDLRVRAWFNPSLRSRVDIVPGLISMVMGLPALSVALAIAREREHGTLEQLMATPVSRLELLMGKMLPYIAVGLANVIIIPIFAIWWFHIPFNGNFLVFLFLSLLFLFAILSMGVVVGVFIRTQAAALAASFLLIFFPGFFLTGIFFPLAAMPEIMRMEGMALPGTHYAIITRAQFLTGVGLDVLWPYGVFMVFLGVAFTAVAALFFKKKLA
jgi:ABC-2 type transport system permease protein